MHVYKGLRKIVSSVGKAFVIAHGASLLTVEDLTFSKPTGYFFAWLVVRKIHIMMYSEILHNLGQAKNIEARVHMRS